MRDKQPMAYVAISPDQPDAAYAVAMDTSREETGELIKKWIQDGSTVERVDLETAKTMLLKWVRK